MLRNNIYKSLLEYDAQGMSSFHTPGHKNNFFKDLYKLDYTELLGTDDLYNPKKSILETEKKASEVFKSGCSLISAGGCTLCIKTMIALFCKYRSKIICSRMIHRSAVHAMAMLNLEPIFLTPKLSKNKDFYEQVTSFEIEKVLKAEKNVSAVYITSPDYYGTIADVASISKVCKEYNVPILIDNAHGSHLAFLNYNYHPLNLGASATADSLHKTLPVLTGGALLHLKDKSLYNKAKYWMEFFGSSSPSFPIMASIDICLDWLEKEGKAKFFDLEKKVGSIKKLACKRGINTLGEWEKRYSFYSSRYISKHSENKLAINSINNSTPNADLIVQVNTQKKDTTTHGYYCNIKTFFDPVRICFNVNSVGLTGKECAEFFRENKVEPEFYDKSFIVLIPTPFNTNEDFYKLKNAIECLPKEEPINKNSADTNFCVEKICCSLYEAVFKLESEKISTQLAVGRVATRAENICPPGIPIVIPGEVITENIAKAMVSNGIDEVCVAKQT